MHGRLPVVSKCCPNHYRSAAHLPFLKPSGLFPQILPVAVESVWSIQISLFSSDMITLCHSLVQTTCLAAQLRRAAMCRGVHDGARCPRQYSTLGQLRTARQSVQRDAAMLTLAFTLLMESPVLLISRNRLRLSRALRIVGRPGLFFCRGCPYTLRRG